LEHQQSLVDDEQEPTDQYKHALTIPGQSVQDAKALANNYVRQHLQQARLYKNAQREDLALQELAIAMHTLQDATSPSHVGFQLYTHLTPAHLVGDLYLTPAFRDSLVEATQTAYVYYDDPSKPLPADFFAGPYPPIPLVVRLLDGVGFGDNASIGLTKVILNGLRLYLQELKSL
jgi:hypothetical protein